MLFTLCDARLLIISEMMVLAAITDDAKTFKLTYNSN